MRKTKDMSTMSNSSLRIKSNTAGITLIALVITIIVLLILAGVSISLVVGENGVLNQATTAVEKNREAKATEEVSMAWSSMETAYLGEWTKNTSLVKNEKYIKDKLTEYLSGTGTIKELVDNGNGTYILTYKTTDDNVFYKMKISTNGKVEILSKGTGFASYITAANYGDKVNYEASNGYSNWKIFYSNGTNVFLIASDYVDKTLVTAGMDQVADASYPYGVYWSSEPSTMSTTARQDALFGLMSYTLNSSYESSKCVSTMLDTANWIGFKDTKGYGEYAVGGPTVEMWINSWNAKGIEYNTEEETKYESLKTETGIYGYYVGLKSTENLTTYSYDVSTNSEVGYNDILYFPNQSVKSNCHGYWLASPTAFSSPNVMSVKYSGKLDYFGVNSNWGFGVRPVVSLSSIVEGTSTTNDDGTITWTLSK